MINRTPSTLFPSIGGPAPRQKFWITNWNQTKISGSEGYGDYISSKEKSCPGACLTCGARHLSTALKKTTASAFKHPTAPTPLWVFDYFEKPRPINGITISKPLIVAAQGMPQATLLTPTVLRFER